ncbi:MAG: hypothetical protein U0K54_05725 [Acutalibacteraceae bacterium]|nr:hypothetical protein [Acutalibacteraceae bacterium]
MDWIVGKQKAIYYIENHLTEKIDFDKVAAQSLAVWWFTLHICCMFSKNLNEKLISQSKSKE